MAFLIRHRVRMLGIEKYERIDSAGLFGFASKSLAMRTAAQNALFHAACLMEVGCGKSNDDLLTTLRLEAGAHHSQQFTSADQFSSYSTIICLAEQVQERLPRSSLFSGRHNVLWHPFPDKPWELAQIHGWNHQLTLKAYEEQAEGLAELLRNELADLFAREESEDAA